MMYRFGYTGHEQEGDMSEDYRLFFDVNMRYEGDKSPKKALTALLSCCFVLFMNNSLTPTLWNCSEIYSLFYWE